MGWGNDNLQGSNKFKVTRSKKSRRKLGAETLLSQPVEEEINWWLLSLRAEGISISGGAPQENSAYYR